jgi:hypothetical protein
MNRIYVFAQTSNPCAQKWLKNWDLRWNAGRQDRDQPFGGNARNVFREQLTCRQDWKWFLKKMVLCKWLNHVKLHLRSNLNVRVTALITNNVIIIILEFIFSSYIFFQLFPIRESIIYMHLACIPCLSHRSNNSLGN